LPNLPRTARLSGVGPFLFFKTVPKQELGGGQPPLTLAFAEKGTALQQQRRFAMPNHAYQKVTLSGISPVIRELYRSVETESFLQRVIPCPIEKAAEWYRWSNDNWGTKWDICDQRIESQSWPDDEIFYLQNTENESFTFYCWTAWSPPIPVWEKLHSIGIHVNASFFCEGGFFVGTWVDGVKTEWAPDDNFAKTSLITEYVLGVDDYFTPVKSETA